VAGLVAVGQKANAQTTYTAGITQELGGNYGLNGTRVSHFLNFAGQSTSFGVGASHGITGDTFNPENTRLFANMGFNIGRGVQGSVGVSTNIVDSEDEVNNAWFGVDGQITRPFMNNPVACRVLPVNGGLQIFPFVEGSGANAWLTFDFGTEGLMRDSDSFGARASRVLAPNRATLNWNLGGQGDAWQSVTFRWDSREFTNNVNNGLHFFLDVAPNRQRGGSSSQLITEGNESQAGAPGITGDASNDSRVRGLMIPRVGLAWTQTLGQR